MNKLPIPFGVQVTLFVFALLVVTLLASGKVPLRYNLRNLAVRWKTTLMTAMAFTLVVGLLTVMLAFVTGMSRLTENSGHPDNVVVMSEGATDEAFSNLGYSDTSDLANLLDDANRARLATNAAGGYFISREKYLVVAQPMAAPGTDPKKARRSFVQVRGIEDSAAAAQVHHIELLPGGAWWYNGVRTIPGKEKELSERGRGAFAVAMLNATPGGLHLPVQKPGTPLGELTAVEGVLGEGKARELGQLHNKATLEVGDIFDLGPRKWIVVGIMKSAGSTFGSEIWGDSALVGDMFGKKVFTSIIVRTKGADEAEQVAKALGNRDITRGAAFAAQTETKYYASLGTTNQQFLFAIVFVAIIIGIGGVFGVMNTMFAAVSQRTKDIGVLRIIGFARWQILVSFFLESLVIAVIGGLIGLGLGSLVHGTSATSIVSRGQGGGKSIVLQLTVDANTVAWAVLFSLGMGTLGGLLPSLSAMRQRPLESLR